MFALIRNADSGNSEPHPKEPRLAIARDNGDIALWDLAKIDRQLTELGLGFAPDPADAPPAKDKP